MGLQSMIVISTALQTTELIKPLQIAVTLLKTFRTPHYRWLRAGCFLALGFFGIVPIIHAGVIYKVSFRKNQLHTTSGQTGPDRMRLTQSSLSLLSSYLNPSMPSRLDIFWVWVQPTLLGC
jgi:hypothetical protein